MNEYDTLLFNDMVKKTKQNKNGDNNINNNIINIDKQDRDDEPILKNDCNTYRGLDISDYPLFKEHMKTYKKRIQTLIKTLVQCDEKKYKNEDVNTEITLKFIEFAYDMFNHFENIETVKNVNERFNLMTKVDKILLGKS
jgi:hypothetical protein